VRSNTQMSPSQLRAKETPKLQRLNAAFPSEELAKPRKIRGIRVPVRDGGIQNNHSEDGEERRIVYHVPCGFHALEEDTQEPATMMQHFSRRMSGDQ
jgi:hypothetical protein